MRFAISFAILISLGFAGVANGQFDAPAPPRFLGYLSGDDLPPPRRLSPEERGRPLLDLFAVQNSPNRVETANLHQHSNSNQVQLTSEIQPLAPIPEPLPQDTFADPHQSYPASLPPVEGFDPNLPPPMIWEEDVTYHNSYCDDCVSQEYLPGNESNETGGDLIVPFLSLMYKAGDERSIVDVRGQLPLWEAHSSLLFADLRGRFDDQEASAGNFGLAYRFITDNDWIWGFYAYYDLLKTGQRNRFNQFTGGFEILTLDHDFRINAYFPNQGGRSSNLMTGISNGTVFTRNFSERAYRGFDFEYGYRFFHWGWQDSSEVRWFNGLYHFDNDASGFDSMTGLKSRLEYRHYGLPWLGNQARFSAGAELSYDSQRDTQVFGFARIRIPLFPASSQPSLDPLIRRFADVPVREID